MTKLRSVIVLLLILFAFVLAGCAGEKKLGEIEETQKEILAKVEKIEQNQNKMLKFFEPRRPPKENPNKVYNIPLGNSPVKGNMSAKATIVEFSDFQCPYCSRLQPTLKQVLDAYPNDVRLVYKQFPLDFHKQAKNASKAALAAGEQGKFWEMHDLLFEKFNALSEAMFTEFAVKLGLDNEQFEADYNSTKYDKQIQDEINLGMASGVRGTPTLYLNGKKMSDRSFNDFKTAIDSILKK